MKTTVVLDINVVLDLWHFVDRRACLIDEQLQCGALRLVTCSSLNQDLKNVLSREAFSASASKVWAHWQTFAHEIELTERAPWRCADADDQKLLDLAVSAKAQALLTRDRALLALARRASASSLQIAKPEGFIACPA